MNQISNRDRAVDLCLWVACGLVVIGIAGELVATHGGTNRIAGIAPPFAVAAVALVANALSWRRTGGFALFLYAAGAIGIVYGLLIGASVPLRLVVEGTCQPGAAACPLGYDYPLTSGENTGLYIAAIAGVLAIVFSFVAVEMQYRRRPVGLASVGSPPPAPMSDPTPEPRPEPKPETVAIPDAEAPEQDEGNDSAASKTAEGPAG